MAAVEIIIFPFYDLFSSDAGLSVNLVLDDFSMFLQGVNRLREKSSHLKKMKRSAVSAARDVLVLKSLAATKELWTKH